MSDKLRVAIAEDNYLVREGTRRLLEDSGEVEVVAAVGTADELIDAVRRLNPDTVITDIRMPPGHHTEGIEAAHAIRGEHADVGVVVLSQYSDEAYAFELFKRGTAGLAYLLKDRVDETEEIISALRQVRAGGSVVDPQVVEKLVDQRVRVVNSPLRHLTDRERDVLAEMAQGKTNLAIAKTLSLSESAVEKHISSIFAKLEVIEEPLIHRRVAAVLTYLREVGLTTNERGEVDGAGTG